MMVWPFPATANPDELLVLLFSVAGFIAAAVAGYLRWYDAGEAETPRGRWVAVKRVHTNLLMALLHLSCLSQTVRLTQPRSPTISEISLLSLYVLPLVPLFALLSTLNDLYIRRGVNRDDDRRRAEGLDVP